VLKVSNVVKLLELQGILSELVNLKILKEYVIIILLTFWFLLKKSMKFPGCAQLVQRKGVCKLAPPVCPSLGMADWLWSAPRRPFLVCSQIQREEITKLKIGPDNLSLGKLFDLW